MARLIDPNERARSYVENRRGGEREMRRRIRANDRSKRDIAIGDPEDWTRVEAVDVLPEVAPEWVGRMVQVRNPAGNDQISVGITDPDGAVFWQPIFDIPKQGTITLEPAQIFLQSVATLAGLAIYGTGELHLMEVTGHRVRRVNVPGNYTIATFGAFGSGVGAFSGPQGIDHDEPRALTWVADSGNNRIQKRDSSFAHVLTIGGTAAGTGPLQFSFPADIACDVNGVGDVWVADRANNRIVGVTTAGAAIRTLGSLGAGDAQLNGPYSLSLNPIDGYLYIADTGNNRVMVWNTLGGFIRKWGSAGQGAGQFAGPRGIACGTDGRVYVTDFNNHRVQVFESSGAFVGMVGGYGTALGQFKYPWGVGLTPNGDNLYVSEYSGARVQMIAMSTDGWVAYQQGGKLTGKASFYFNDSSGDLSVPGRVYEGNPHTHASHSHGAPETYVNQDSPRAIPINGGNNSSDVYCGNGYHAVGGGYDSGSQVTVHTSMPLGSNPPTGWRAAGRNPTANARDIAAYVVCRRHDV